MLLSLIKVLSSDKNRLMGIHIIPHEDGISTIEDDQLIVDGLCVTLNEFIKSIKKAFVSEKMICDAQIGDHIVNICFPDYALAFCFVDDFDQSKEDMRREQVKALGYKYACFDLSFSDIFFSITCIHRCIMDHIMEQARG